MKNSDKVKVIGFTNLDEIKKKSPKEESIILDKPQLELKQTPPNIPTWEDDGMDEFSLRGY